MTIFFLILADSQFTCRKTATCSTTDIPKHLALTSTAIVSGAPLASFGAVYSADAVHVRPTTRHRGAIDGANAVASALTGATFYGAYTVLKRSTK